MTQSIRNQLGITQDQLAQFLYCTKSQLAMSELGQRELPTATLQKLAGMAVFLTQTQNETLEERELIKNNEQQLLQCIESQIKELEYQQLKTERLLERMKKKYEQNLRLYQWALYLKTKDEPLADVFLNQATKALNQNSLVQQTKELLKQASIQCQQNYLHTLKEKQIKT